MATRISLREYQRDLVERLRNAGSGHTTSKLGLQVGNEGWLVDLADISEVIPAPSFTHVPLTRSWFTGVANIRGNLYSVVDFSAFLGGAAVTVNEDTRLLLVGERFRMGSALLIDRSLGLRNAEQLRELPNGKGHEPWVKAKYADTGGGNWKELDIPQLVRHPDFLGVAS